MKHHKISKLLIESTVSNVVKKKWMEVNDLSGNQYSVNKNIRFKFSMLRSNLCDCSDEYIVVKGRIDVLAAAENKAEENAAFKSNGLLRLCISKFNSTLIYNAENLDIVIPMYSLLEYSKNYSMRSVSL